MPPELKRAVANGPGSRRVRLTLAGLAGLYLAGLWLETAGAPLVGVVPRPFLYFMQIARLFPNALQVVTEYRAEAYSCEDQRWSELDVRPYFPLRPNDKENRFERAMFFYRHSGIVMKALDDYLVGANNAAGRPAIGGVMLLSLRIPIPPPSVPAPPYRRIALDDYPADYRKYWYRTSLTEANERCDQEAKARESTNR